MKLLDYGLNEIDAFVPKHRRTDAEEQNLSAMVDMLMRSGVMRGSRRTTSRASATSCTALG
jgi:hypothetical protein